MDSIMELLDIDDSDLDITDASDADITDADITDADIEEFALPPPESPPSTPGDRILKSVPIPDPNLADSPQNLLTFTVSNPHLIPDIVSAILPTSLHRSPNKSQFTESLHWLQYLMFAETPETALKNISQNSGHQRSVCGVVWRKGDLSYKCRTCGNDETCSICVSCFKDGDHEGHDYKLMYSQGGCCDCGDGTAWERAGFCKNHQGSERMQQLDGVLAERMGRVIDPLFLCWRDMILVAEEMEERIEEDGMRMYEGVVMVVSEMTAKMVKMLMGFCECSESLLSFICGRLVKCNGLLDALLRSERLMHKKYVVKIYDLFLKLIGEPGFKYEFGKVFVEYYSFMFRGNVEYHDSVLNGAILLHLDVQIFTVPALALRLVEEVDLLGVLLGSLRDIFNSCVDEDGRLQVSKWEDVSDITSRVVTDTRCVLSHNEVLKYVDETQPLISKTWIWLLGLVQGMDPQKRITGVHIEEENENLQVPFVLSRWLGNVNNVLVEGAFSLLEPKKIKEFIFGCLGPYQFPNEGDTWHHGEVGNISRESTESYTTRSGSVTAMPYCEVHSGTESLPSSVEWLFFECLEAIERWLWQEIGINSASGNI